MSTPPIQFMIWNSVPTPGGTLDSALEGVAYQNCQIESLLSGMMLWNYEFTSRPMTKQMCTR